RAVEYHPSLVRRPEPGGSDAAPRPAAAGDPWDRPTHLVLDLDPPAAEGYGLAVRAAELVRHALAEVGLTGAVKTSGAKGLHVFVPLGQQVTGEDAAAATRAVAARAQRLDPALATTAFIREDRGGKVYIDPTRAGGATVVAVYSPRIRPGTPVSFPVPWDDLDRVTPREFTLRTVVPLIADRDPWTDAMPAPQTISADLIDEGRAIPVPRVQAMHEGRRRARARRAE
ncbi:MAG TPA: ATP-dependent DNA ligase, partial [Micromonosporaceae bacterium]